MFICRSNFTLIQSSGTYGAQSLVNFIKLGKNLPLLIVGKNP